MKSEFKIYKVEDDRYNKEIGFNVTSFPCGEIQVKLDQQYLIGSDLVIHAAIKDSEGIMALLQLKACLDIYLPKSVCLLLGYIPYSRQDRICNKGECVSIKIFANLVNSMNFDQVMLTDPHSEVTPALFNKVVVLEKDVLFETSLDRSIVNYDTFVAPDAGASKEVEKMAIYFGRNFIQGYKKRDTLTGELSGFGYYGDVQGKDLLIVDDLCDGGGTFLGLAQELRKGNPNTLSLYVTHGCFTKGLDELKNTFDEIFTCNSFNTDLKSDGQLTVIPLLFNN